ncbi:MAG: DUF4956 domain-containing protein [Saprospiraceae bacterium]
MFDISSIQYNSENPTLIAIVFTVLCALLLGVMISFTYEKTSRTVTRPDHFLQAMVLITVVAATIIQAIGDSVARGLGMLGALSIIRFRTTVRDPRNIVFIFSSIAAGIACGVFGFLIAFVGTIGFCLTAFLLRFSSFSKKKSLTGTLRLQVPRDYESYPELEKELNTFCKKYAIVSYKVFPSDKKAHLMLYEYRLKLRDTFSGGNLVANLKEFPDLKVISLVFQNDIGEAI